MKKKKVSKKEERDEINRLAASVAVIGRAQARHAKTGKNKGWMRCPLCKKKHSVRWTRSTNNGHVWAKCKTPGCIQFVQ
jgi:hypothetical protein